MAIQDNYDPDSQKKSAFISLFERYHPGAHDMDTMWALMGRLLMFYRPAKEMGKSLAYHQASTLTLACQIFQYYLSDEENAYSKLALHLLGFHILEKPLHWALRNIKGKIIGWDGYTTQQALHRIFSLRMPFTDPLSMKLIIQKSAPADFNAVYKPWSLFHWQRATFTPLALALHNPAMFAAWRNELVNCGYCVSEFISKELKGSPLIDEGWTFDTLLAVFNTEIAAEWTSHLAPRISCDRCGEVDLHYPLVYLPWRRYLRAIRNGRTDVGTFDLKIVTDRYELVCARNCSDGWCVSGVFENELADTDMSFGPGFPGYVEREEREAREAVVALGERRMPGAYVE